MKKNQILFALLITTFIFTTDCMQCLKLAKNETEVARVVQPNGKTTVLVIRPNADQTEQLIIYRIKPDSTFDESFGNHSYCGFEGTQTYSLLGHPHIDIKSVDIQPDGKVLITMIRDDEWHGKELSITRLDEEGIDNTFGFFGIETYHLDPSYKEKLE